MNTSALNPAPPNDHSFCWPNHRDTVAALVGLTEQRLDEPARGACLARRRVETNIDLGDRRRGKGQRHLHPWSQGPLAGVLWNAVGFPDGPMALSPAHTVSGVNIKDTARRRKSTRKSLLSHQPHCRSQTIYNSQALRRAFYPQVQLVSLLHFPLTPFPRPKTNRNKQKPTTPHREQNT